MALNRRLASLGLASLALTLALVLSATTTMVQAQAQAQTLSRSVLPAQPADHLVPPPLPTAQRLSHAAGYSEVASATVPEPPGFMTRVARWFGLGGQTARDQQLGASASSSNYAYPKPVQSFDAAGKPCSLCNKYPWVPMVGQQQQKHPQHQQHPTQQQQQQQQQAVQSWQVQQQPLAQASQHRQRAVQFRGPPAAPAGQSVFLPITVPLPALSHVALPPLYNAQPFRPLENVAAPSEVRASTVPPVPPFRPAPSPRPYSPSIPSIPSIPSSSNFEIVQSHQLTDFVTSVEYPATFVPSHAIDLGAAHRPSSPSEQQHQQQHQHLLQDISTVRYQLEDLSSGSVHQHLPASQLLTELGHFAETTTQQLPPADNYPAASSQQLQQEQEQEQEQEQQLYYAEQYQTETETSTVVYTTTEQPPTAAPPAPPAPPAPVVEVNNHLAAVHHRGIYHQSGSRGRETPKRLLDSPINHALVAGGARPFTRDPADLSFRLSQVYTPTPAPPTPTSTYGAIDASGQYAGMSPPSPQQVIIPYTTKQRPRPFEPWVHVHSHNHNGNRNGNRNGNHNHSQDHDDNDVEEPHEQQESKLATATVTAPPPPNTHRTTKYLTKILASNLRELLKRERETKRRPLGVDISRLQHNIDGWTEQEYNSLSHRPSTPTIRGRSKHIPTEYLTTTTTTPAPDTAAAAATATAPGTGAAQPLTRQSKTTRGGGFELGGGSAPPTNAGDLSTSINNLEQLHLLGERSSKRFQPLEDNRLHLDYYEGQQRPRPAAAMTTPLPSTSTSTTTTRTTPMMHSSEDAVTPLYVRSTQAPKELWKQAQVAILPQTNEKVYVVTPQPRHQAYHPPAVHQEVSASASAPRPVYHQTPAPASTPRFPRVRPTPGTAGEPKAATPTISSSQLHNYTPDIFGLMGLSAYVPADPVEIIDGNSKVITIVTAAPTAAALQRPTARPTMSPSPR